MVELIIAFILGGAIGFVIGVLLVCNRVTIQLEESYEQGVATGSKISSRSEDA